MIFWAGIAFACVAAVIGTSIIVTQSSKKRDLVSVEIRTDPQGASVSLGDRGCVSPNCRFELSPGKYPVDARLEGYSATRQVLEIKPNSSGTTFRITLDPIVPTPGDESTQRSTDTGRLTIEANQDHLQVLVNGKIYASGAEKTISLVVQPGPYDVTVEKRGFQTAAPQRINIRKDRTGRLVFALKASVNEQALELQAWNQARANGDIPGFNRYLGIYPDGPHAAEARQIIDRLKAEEAARDQAARDQAARDQAARDKAERDRAEADKAAKEAAEKAAREKAIRDQAVRDQTARDKADRDKADADKAAKDKADRDKLERDNAARTSDTKAIMAALDRYKSAYVTKNVNTLRSVWPKIPNATLAGVRLAFSHGGSFNMDIQLTGAPVFDRDTAIISCRRTVTQDGRTTPDNVKFHFQRDPTGWVIVSIE